MHIRYKALRSYVMKSISELNEFAILCYNLVHS